MNDYVFSEFTEFMFLGGGWVVFDIVDLILRGATIYFLRVFWNHIKVKSKKDNFFLKRDEHEIFFLNMISITISESSTWFFFSNK